MHMLSHSLLISFSFFLCVCGGNIFAHFEIIKKLGSKKQCASIFISRLDYKNICGIYMNYGMRSAEYPVNKA